MRRYSAWMTMSAAALALACASLSWSPGARADDLEDAVLALQSGDYASALALYRPLAAGGHAQAQAALGWLYFHGRGVPRDVPEAERWFDRAAAQGDPRGDYGRIAVADAYAFGRGVTQDCQKALRILQGLKDRNVLTAQAALGRLYIEGCGRMPRSVDAGVRLVRDAAQKGDPLAQADMGSLYARGVGVVQSYPEAMRWYCRSAAQGNPEAEMRMAMMYERGEGVAVDRAEAATWLRRAAAHGLPAAQHALGLAYQFGLGVPVDAAEARRWFAFAATQGHAPSTAALQELERSASRPHARTAFPQSPARALDLPALAQLHVRIATADALDIARSYQYTQTTQALLALAERGATVVTPEGTISRTNVAEIRQDLAVRTHLYADAIRERGFLNVAGRYRAAATAACRDAQSAWAAVLLEPAVREVVVEQSAFTLRVAVAGDEPAFEVLATSGVVVESSVVIVDPMNSTYNLVSATDDGALVLRPDADRILAGWTPMLPPPPRRALDDCAVTLTPVR